MKGEVGGSPHAHLLMTIARMMGSHPNFRIFTMGGFCLAMRTHTGIRAVKPTHTSGVRYRLSVGREGVCARAHEHGLVGHSLGCKDDRWAENYGHWRSEETPLSPAA